MEDHLKNKGRLQREWEALCRYEAEPSSREAAIQPQCEPFNRPTAPLPYDHSRVVVNHLANTEGLDYINASTIVSSNHFIKKKLKSYGLSTLFQNVRPITIPAHQPTLPPRARCPLLSPTSGRWYGSRAPSSSSCCADFRSREELRAPDTGRKKALRCIIFTKCILWANTYGARTTWCARFTSRICALRKRERLPNSISCLGPNSDSPLQRRHCSSSGVRWTSRTAADRVRL